MNIHEIWQTIRERADARGHDYVPKLGEWRASMLPYCGRKQIFRKNPEWIELRTVSDASRALGSHHIGHAIHEYVQNLLGKLALAVEKPVSHTFRETTVSGHIDLILEIDGKSVITDIKTFHESEKYDVRKYLPNEHHVEQLSIYCAIEGNWNALLIYIERNTGEPLFFWPEEETLKKYALKMMQTAEILTEHERLHILPEPKKTTWNRRERKKELDWECRFCEFRPTCWTEWYRCEECSIHGFCHLGDCECRRDCGTPVLREVKIS